MNKVNCYCACIFRHYFEIETINSLRNQPEFATIDLTLNNYTDEQYQYVSNYFADDNRIIIHRHNNEKTSNEKLRYISSGNEKYVCLVDNDILYPNDYLAKLIKGSTDYHAMVSLHGCVLAPRPIGSYYRDRFVYRGLATVISDYEVDIASNCGSLWQREMFDNYDHWYENSPMIPMDDLIVANECRKRNVICMVIKHQEGYIRHKIQEKDEIYVFNMYKFNDKVQTNFINLNWK